MIAARAKLVSKPETLARLRVDARPLGQGPDLSLQGANLSLKVFIVGGPRSGTSVLTRAMRLVFELPGHGESHVMPIMALVAHHLRRYRERFRLQPEDLLVQAFPFPALEEAAFQLARDFYRASYAGESWVDKTPSDEAVHGITIIPAVFPDARIIVTRRNGIEVVESLRWKFGLSFADACRNWVSAMTGVMLARKRCPEALEVDQHDFLNEPERVARRIANHLGRPERAAALAEFLFSDRLDWSAKHDWTRRATMDAMDWTSEERATFREVCGTCMHSSGYAMDSPGAATIAVPPVQSRVAVEVG